MSHSVSVRVDFFFKIVAPSGVLRALYLFFVASHQKYAPFERTYSTIYVRTAARDQAWVHYTRTKLTEVGIQYVDVYNLIEQFRDCTHDGSHHILGVPEAVADHRIIPWICSLHD